MAPLDRKGAPPRYSQGEKHRTRNVKLRPASCNTSPASWRSWRATHLKHRHAPGFAAAGANANLVHSIQKKPSCKKSQGTTQTNRVVRRSNETASVRGIGRLWARADSSRRSEWRSPAQTLIDPSTTLTSEIWSARSRAHRVPPQYSNTNPMTPV